MKLRYFIPTILAAIAMLTACSEKYEATYLGELRVSKSYISLPAEGGEATIEVNANQAWAAADVPDWLIVTPASGEAGITTVSIKADEAEETRTATFKLNAGNATQEINVIQQTEKAEVPLSTCAQVIAGEDSKTYRVKGSVKSIANTTYGNWYLQDETGEVYIYGTLDKSGKDGQNNSIAAWGIEVGDIVTVEGPKTTYNGTVELVNVTVVDIEKSLIKVAEVAIEGNTLPLEGGDFEVTLENKGQGLVVNIPDEAKSWLSTTGIAINGTEAKVAFHAAANTGGTRSTTVSFITTDGTKDYTCETTITQAGAIVEATVADFLAAEVGEAQFRLTGVITALYDRDSQGKSFYISDYSGQVLVYRAEGFIEAGAKVGDVVTVVGQRGAYKETPQMVSGTFEVLNHSVVEVTLDEFLTKEDSKDVYYMVTGTVDEIVNDTYGNLYLKSGETRLYVYGCYPGWGASGDARKGCIAAKDIAVGDELTVIGVKSTYNDAPQVANGIYFSHKKAE